MAGGKCAKKRGKHVSGEGLPGSKIVEVDD